mmetsp:Transcript_34075/g.77736  ORF Transcript_34075/g.77736 Transcript_34075/m.77736 type:complete len:350 (-) Transcript_34075:75-1124(-)
MMKTLFASLAPDTPGAETAWRLVAAGRRESTVASYNGKFQRFVTFCAMAGLCPLPATLSTVLAYLGWLSEEDLVHHTSLQPYLTAINSAHKDLGFDAPAEGRIITLARKGFGEIEAAERGVPPAHTALPSRVVKQILIMGLASDDLLVVRRCAAIAFLFAFFARADSGVIALRTDVTVSEQGLEFVENGKNLERMRPATLVLPWGSGGAVAGELSVPALMQRYLGLADAAWEARGRAGVVRELWRLPSDPRPETPLSSDIIGTWLGQCLGDCGVTPPLGQAWTRHSMRSGGATAALAIGVDPFTIARWGVWKSFNSVTLYVDPLVRGCSAAALFFRHLLKPTAEQWALP